MKLRAPAIPLITVDPYFNVWSCRDTLNEAASCHWTGQTNTINGLLFIDGTAYRFMGGEEAGGIPMRQIEVEVTALTSKYIFEAAGVQLTVRFFTPIFVDDLTLCSRPVSYLELYAKCLDGVSRTLLAEISVSEEICLNIARQEPVQVENLCPMDGVQAIRIGGTSQNVVGAADDDIRIDWGYFYLCVYDGIVGQRTKNGETFVTASANLSDESVLFVFAYDDIYSIEYFGKPLHAYWKKEGKTIEGAIADAFMEYPALCARERCFSRRLWTQAEEAGGEKYAELVTLAYRQVMAGHKLVEDEQGNLLYISKECMSNGCAATVDVSYPSFPMFLFFNPILAQAMLRPILHYASSGEWKAEYAPHDVGRYPLLNGQAYPDGPEHRMPLEECGNMLIMTAALSEISKNAELFETYKEQYCLWAKYLMQHGIDPEHQNCTDDFFKPIAHNCNLEIKAIIGIACMGLLLERSGNQEMATFYKETAHKKAREWVQRASNGDGSYRLAFDRPNTYSLKYNIVWDKVLNLSLFTNTELMNEFDSYWKYMNPYGIPLDSRGSTSKTDWQAWIGVLAPDQESFKKLIAPVWRYFNETENRVPMADWYSTKTAKYFYMLNRTVQGGLFFRLLTEKGMMKGDGTSDTIEPCQ